MSRDLEAEEAAARELTACGYRTMTSETWSRQGALDALRELRIRHRDDPLASEMAQLVGSFADRLAKHTGLSPEDIASVLLVAGASVAALAVLHDVPAPVIVQILQATAVELDDRAKAGESS